MEEESEEYQKLMEDIRRDFEETDAEIEKIERKKPSLLSQIAGVTWGIICIAIGIAIIYFFDDLGIKLFAIIFFIWGIGSLVARQIFMGG